MKTNRSTKIYSQAKCAWCDGTGKSNIVPGIASSCIVCGGKGEVAVEQPADHCRQCQGTGRRTVRNACLNCAGIGWEHSKAAGV